MGNGSFPGVKSGRGVTLTPHPLLMPWSWKGRAIPLLPLWAVRPVQSVSACTRVHFTFTFTIYSGRKKLTPHCRCVNIKIRWDDEHSKPPEEIIQIYNNLWNDQSSLSVYDGTVHRCSHNLLPVQPGARIQRIRFYTSSGIDGIRTDTSRCHI